MAKRKSDWIERWVRKELLWNGDANNVIGYWDNTQLNARWYGREIIDSLRRAEREARARKRKAKP